MRHPENSRVQGLTVLGALLALMLPATAGAQLGGTWDITATFEFEVPCDYTGTGMLSQKGDTVTGTLDLTLDDGGHELCPPTMVGELTATVMGNDFTGTVDGATNPEGDLGGASVSGTIDVPPSRGTTNAVASSTTMSGSSSTSSGPFTGAVGTFMGTLQPVTAPAMGPLAVAVLALLLLGGSTLLLTRRRSA